MMTTTKLKVSGMTCDHCVRAVTRALEETPGVSSAKVHLAGSTALVEYDETRTNPRDLEKAIMNAGYPAEESV
jgi:copper chaperone CopZ